MTVAHKQKRRGKEGEEDEEDEEEEEEEWSVGCCTSPSCFLGLTRFLASF